MEMNSWLSSSIIESLKWNILKVYKTIVKASVVVKWDPDLMSILREKCVIETCWTCTKPVLEQMGLLSEILMCLYWEKNVSLNILKVYKTKIRAVGVAKWDPDVAILRLYCLLAAN